MTAKDYTVRPRTESEAPLPLLTEVAERQHELPPDSQTDLAGLCLVVVEQKLAIERQTWWGRCLASRSREKMRRRVEIVLSNSTSGFPP